MNFDNILGKFENKADVLAAIAGGLRGGNYPAVFEDNLYNLLHGNIHIPNVSQAITWWVGNSRVSTAAMGIIVGIILKEFGGNFDRIGSVLEKAGFGWLGGSLALQLFTSATHSSGPGSTSPRYLGGDSNLSQSQFNSFYGRSV